VTLAEFLGMVIVLTIFIVVVVLLFGTTRQANDLGLFFKPLIDLIKSWASLT